MATRHGRLTLRILGLEIFRDKGIAYLHIEKTREFKALQTDIVNLTACLPCTPIVMDWQWTPHVSFARANANARFEQWKQLPRQSGEVAAEWLELSDWDSLERRYRLASQTFGSA
jgi:hypothetical protein